MTYVSNLYFFLQAEDGIRYYKVTGVQTCALPISNQIHSLLTRSLKKTKPPRHLHRCRGGFFALGGLHPPWEKSTSPRACRRPTPQPSAPPTARRAAGPPPPVSRPR